MGRPTLACMGGRPRFELPIPVGQLYFPDWERYVATTRGIFEREYYTNQGPLTCRLEEALQDFFGVKHAICVTNATIGLMMAAEALELSGKVIVPSFTFIASAQSLAWCGLQPVFCDVDRNTHHITTDTLEAAMTAGVTGVLGVNLWGNAADVDTIDKWAQQQGVASFWDSAQAVGCEVADRRIGQFGQLEVFSLHATKILSATEGGCITTNDNELAKRLRNIRSSYGAGSPAPVVKTSNGRMSEFQAAIALMSLQDFQQNRSNNKALLAIYRRLLDAIPGVEIMPMSGVSSSNHQYAVVSIDPQKFGMARDALVQALHADNVMARRYFFPGCHRTIPFDQATKTDLPNTDQLCEELLQLPLGAKTTQKVVHDICELIADIKENADVIDT